MATLPTLRGRAHPRIRRPPVVRSAATARDLGFTPAITLVIAVGLSLMMLFSTGAATAAPGSSSAQSEYDQAAAEVERLKKLEARAEETLARLTVEAEAAADASRRAEAELRAVEVEAENAGAELAAATDAVENAREDIANLGREAYIGADSLGTAAALLDSRGPQELLQRAATLDLLGEDRSERLTRFQTIQQRQTEADQAARAAVAQRDRAAGRAAEAEAAATAELARAQNAYDDVTAKQARYERQLRDAEIRLLAAQGSADPTAAWEDQINQRNASADAAAAAIAAAAAAGQAVPPTTGRVTSCYGARWGTTHYGVDIAAPIGTPIYAPQAGRVLQAGPASGFGLAVYIQHTDGSITVYGHINAYFVGAGQQVAAGQQIAEVGNKGQSTGPHLHFEVHTGGLYQNRVDPVPWLAARGVSLGGGC